MLAGEGRSCCCDSSCCSDGVSCCTPDQTGEPDVIVTDVKFTVHSKAHGNLALLEALLLKSSAH